MQKFGLDALDKLDDGRVQTAWNQALARVIADCHDRPVMDKPRVVTLQMAVVPMTDDLGNLDTVRVAFVVDEKLPKRESRVYNMLPRGQHNLAFNDLSQDDVHQRTLDEQSNGGFEIE